MFGKLSLIAIVPLVLALCAGALVPLQASSNAALGRELGHPLWASLVSLLVSTAALLIALLVLRVSPPTLANAVQGPWWLWIGGMGGAFYLAMATVLPPRFGVLNFMLLVMVGQAVAAMLIDHFGLLGLPARPATLLRVTGMLIILCGLVMVQIGASRPAAPTLVTISAPETLPPK